MDEVNGQKIQVIKAWLGSGSINIFGTPYAGKDTQGERLADLLGARLLGGGEILRNSAIPRRAKEIIDKGGLAPTEDYINIVLPYLSKSEFSTKPLVLSSVGRWHGEEKAVVASTAAAGHPIKAVIFLKLDAETAKHRWQIAQSNKDRGVREDDSKEAQAMRLQEFNSKTLPVIEYYRNKSLMITVDGTLSKDEVTQQIIDSLYEFSKTH